MSGAASWKTMAIAGPSLSILVFLAFTPPGRAWVFQVATCQLHMPGGTQAGVLLAMSVLSAAITLTFMTAALQNTALGWLTRTAWVLALLLASPFSVPVYWFVHLRDGSA